MCNTLCARTKGETFIFYQLDHLEEGTRWRRRIHTQRKRYGAKRKQEELYGHKNIRALTMFPFFA